MPRIPWRNQKPYEQISNDDSRHYPYFPNQAVASPRTSPKHRKNHESTLELGPSEPVSPLRFGESTSSFSAAAIAEMIDAPLVPPIVQPKPRPRLKRSSSINRRSRSRSSDAPVRRRVSKDMMLQKTAILQSIEQREPGQNLKATKPIRRRSLEESQQLLGFHKAEPGSEKSSTNSRIHKTRLHDGSHRHHRRMTRLRRSQSPQSHADKSIESARSSDSHSSNSGERRLRRSARSLESSPTSEKKGELNLNSIVLGQRRRHHRRSDGDLKSLKTRYTSVKGTDGCCIIRPNYRFTERPRSFEYKKQSKDSPSAHLLELPQQSRRLAKARRRCSSRSINTSAD